MRFNDAETREMQTWFGIRAKITIGPGFIHKTGVAGLLIPHPPMANRLLRIGLPDRLHRKRSFAHEFAHFQTAPLLAAYFLALLAFAFAFVEIRPGIAIIFLLLVSTQAVWEIMSEGYTILRNVEAYRRWYEGVTKVPRILFWVLGGLLAASGWGIVLF
jgi:hypothetical protein